MSVPALAIDSRPVRIPDDTPIEARLEALNALAAAAAQHPLVAAIGADIHRRGPSRQARLALALEWAHHTVRYVPDPTGQEWFQGPLWTLAHGGDCEDLATLLLAVLVAARGDARLVWQSVGDDDSHVTVEGWDGRAWRYLDPTVPGALLGEEPHHAARRTGYSTRMYGAAK